MNIQCRVILPVVKDFVLGGRKRKFFSSALKGSEFTSIWKIGLKRKYKMYGSTSSVNTPIVVMMVVIQYFQFINYL